MEQGCSGKEEGAAVQEGLQVVLLGDEEMLILFSQNGRGKGRAGRKPDIGHRQGLLFLLGRGVTI